MQSLGCPGSVVLVVEDEGLLRLQAVDMIEAAGFTVVEAVNADKAIGTLESRSDVWLVFTDIDMPGSMDGLDLAALIHVRWPPIELILTSGHIDVKPEQLPVGARFFAKPYLESEVVAALRQMAA